MGKNSSVITGVSGKALPLRGNDIDTDRIIPARYLRCVTFEGLGAYVFQDERFDQNGTPGDHPFNDERFGGSSILLVNRNFGCGSSREHAPQAIMRFGIKAIVGESFAEIFAGNCISIGVVAVTVDEQTVSVLQELAESAPATGFSIDIAAEVLTAGERTYPVSINRAAKDALLAGTWDTLDVLLGNRELIEQVSRSLPYAI